jgi:hypothetical protein
MMPSLSPTCCPQPWSLFSPKTACPIANGNTRPRNIVPRGQRFCSMRS